MTGIGPKRAARIIAGWAEQKIIREIMLFLHTNGVGTSRSVRIYKTYGVEAVQLITENPYRLARDIRGIGFRTADQVAQKLGIEPTAMIRVRAGISFALAEASGEIESRGEITSEVIPQRLNAERQPALTPADSKPAPYIEFKEVSKAFGDNLVLDRVSFERPRAAVLEAVAVAEPSVEIVPDPLPDDQSIASTRAENPVR